jgi:hypothetical protein
LLKTFFFRIYEDVKESACVPLYLLCAHEILSDANEILCRSHEILSRAHEKLCRGDQLLFGALEIIKWCPRDNMSWPRATKLCLRDN